MESELNIIKSKVDGLNDKVADKLSISLRTYSTLMKTK